ncbi:endonuclease V [Candidatus Pacearchaeota archaeon]|nr:endonuclease V [Candidatus Pacearchaeota archaeon]
MSDQDSRKEELSKKYGINFDKLEEEQLKLTKDLEIKDKIDFSLIERYGGIDTSFVGNKILSCIIVCDKNYEIIDKAYFLDKIKFPYFPGFRNYRELPAMISAFEKLNEKPDIVFVSGQGIMHDRLGLASHFGLSTNRPTIGVSNSLVNCNVKEEADGEKINKKNKQVGITLTSKPGSRPMYISPGNHISIEKSYEISKDLINPPHKKPEPLHLAGKYAREVKKELTI